MIRPALLAAPFLALSVLPALAEEPVAARDPGGPPAMQTVPCRPQMSEMGARFSQRAGTHAGWTWLDLRLSVSGERSVFARVSRNGQMAWQGYLTPGQPQAVTLGNGDGRITNAMVSQQTTLVCGINPPG